MVRGLSPLTSKNKICNVKRLKTVILLLGLLLPLTSVAQSKSDEIEAARKDMYRLYSKDSVEQFMTVTDRLKELTRHVDEPLFYKTWSNQALYLYRKVSREKGLAVVKEEREYALKNDEKYGLYAASSAYTTMMSSSGLLDLAEKGLYESIDYLHRYFPNESAAVDYIGLAKIFENKNDYEKVVEYARLALKEPGVSDVHQVSAKSYICVGMAKLIATGKGNMAAFARAYRDFKVARDSLGYDGSLSTIPDYYNSKLNGRYVEALGYAQLINSKQNRLPLVAEAYALIGDYKQAYETYREYKHFNDSLNLQNIQQQTAEYALQLNVARAENEAKDLRLAAQLSREHTYHLEMAFVGVVALLTIGFLAFYLNRRRRQMQLLQQAYDQLETTTTAKERIESELRIARNIQMGMVPRRFPAFPEHDNIDLYALLQPAREVGGDLYDYFLQNDRLFFCIGDVSGKGVAASMTMAVIVNLFRMVAKEGFPPAYIATRLNDSLAADNENGMFATMLIGVIDLRTGTMDCCNCGHTLALLSVKPEVTSGKYTGDDAYRFLEMESNVPLGLIQEFEFQEEHFANISDKVLLVYTDGLTEAENSQQEQYGEDRLFQLVTSHPFASARQTVELVQESVAAYVGSANPSDDLAMLCLKIHINDDRDGTVQQWKLTIRNEMGELRRLHDFLESIGETLGIDDELMMNLQLVMEEAVSNVVYYAYDEGVVADIMLDASSEGHMLTFVLTDDGRAFDPTQKEPVDLNVHPAVRKTGGLGIYIVKQIMDEVTYRRDNGKNILTMKKRM